MGYTGSRVYKESAYAYTGNYNDACTYVIGSSTLLDLGSYQIFAASSLNTAALKVKIDKGPVVSAAKICSSWTGHTGVGAYATDCTAS